MPKKAPDSRTDLFTLRRRITDLVAQNAVALVQQAIDAVNEEGQYQAKYLFEVIGLYPASAGDDSPVEDSLAKRSCITWGCRKPCQQIRRSRRKNPQRPIP